MTNAAQIGDLGRFYRRQLLEDIMPFWASRTRDRECGGYLTCCDRSGQSTDTDKYIWLHGRQIWMFSALYDRAQNKDSWLDLARHGRDFVVRNAYDGDGRWHFRLDRTGAVKESTISIFTDMHVLEGLCAYAVATGSSEDMAVIEQTYEGLERNVKDHDFRDIHHAVWNPLLKHHSIPVVMLSVAQAAEPVLGPERTRPLIDYCLEQILHVFARDEQRAVLESVGRDDSFIDSAEGRIVNPGHSLESMGFCLEEGCRRDDGEIVARALRIVDWTHELGCDRECGGILSFVDIGGGEPLRTDWFAEVDMQWDEKSFWVHAEALYTLALAAVTSAGQGGLDRFLALHGWCWKHLHDPTYGEWYSELFRDGSPKCTDKGTMWKAAYHVPRAIMKLMLLFERAAPS